MQLSAQFYLKTTIYNFIQGLTVIHTLRSSVQLTSSLHKLKPKNKRIIFFNSFFYGFYFADL
jgi:hypothetical protein